jgi:hypothetical protein
MSNQEPQPDPSASTQEFRRFVRSGDAEAAASGSGGPKTLIIGGVILAVVVVAVVAFVLL